MDEGTQRADRGRLLQASTDEAMAIVRLLAEEIGPRPPCSASEAEAARALVGWCRERGIDARLEAFSGYQSGGEQVGALATLGLVGGMLQRRRPLLGAAIAGGALALGAVEADLRRTPVSDLLSRKPSANLVASIPPSGKERSRICLSGHMDSTRSGLIFDPRVIKWLPIAVQIPGLSLATLVIAPLAGKREVGRMLRGVGLAGLVLTLALTLERELRGIEVHGANDNASGTAVALTLAAEIAASPLEHTRVDVLITGCEEAWTLGAIARLNQLEQDPEARDTVFFNFDTVGGDVPQTYILNEGLISRPASARLVGLCERLAAERPELNFKPASGTAGLPTDITPALARGYEAITILAQSDNGVIPNYHCPSDTYGNVSRDAIGRALEIGRELIQALEPD